MKPATQSSGIDSECVEPPFWEGPPALYNTIHEWHNVGGKLHVMLKHTASHPNNFINIIHIWARHTDEVHSKPLTADSTVPPLSLPPSSPSWFSIASSPPHPPPSSSAAPIAARGVKEHEGLPTPGAAENMSICTFWKHLPEQLVASYDLSVFPHSIVSFNLCLMGLIDGKTQESGLRSKPSLYDAKWASLPFYWPISQH